MDDKKFEEAAKESLKNLKKLLAGKGALQGNFYCVVSKDSKQVGLVVTLSAKDKTGAKAAGQGKALRGLIKGPRVARGTVVVDGKQLTFAKDKGNAAVGILKKGFRDVLSKEAGMSFLKKARFSDSLAPEETSGETPEDIEATELELSEEELAEMADLLRSDPDLAAFFDDSTRKAAVAEQNRLLAESFLSAEASATEQAEIRAKRGRVLSKTIDDLSGRDELSDDEQAQLKAARAEFASLQDIGPSPYPEHVGVTVSPDTAVLLGSSNDENVGLVDDLFQKSAREVVERGRRLESMPEEKRTEFARKVMPEVTPHYDATVEYTRASKDLTDL